MSRSRSGCFDHQHRVFVRLLPGRETAANLSFLRRPAYASVADYQLVFAKTDRLRSTRGSRRSSSSAAGRRLDPDTEHKLGMDEERGPAEHARDLTGEVARDRIGLQSRAPRDPGARRLRLLGRVRHRALLPQRPSADHLRRHHPDPQDDAGRARTRLPQPERRDGDASPLASWEPALSGVHRAAGPYRPGRSPRNTPFGQ